MKTNQTYSVEVNRFSCLMIFVSSTFINIPKPTLIYQYRTNTDKSDMESVSHTTLFNPQEKTIKPNISITRKSDSPHQNSSTELYPPRCGYITTHLPGRHHWWNKNVGVTESSSQKNSTSSLSVDASGTNPSSSQ